MQDIGNEMVTRVENMIFRLVSETDAGFGPVRRARSGSLRLPRHRVALPTVLGICLIGFPGVVLCATPGYSNGIPSGCAVTEIREIPELACGFVLYDAGGEWVMRRECPGFTGGPVVETTGLGASGIARSTLTSSDENAGTPAGVLAVKGSVTGGIATLNHRLPAGKPPASSHRRLRRGKGTPEIPELGCGFILYDVEGEGLMRRDCPGFCPGNVESGRFGWEGGGQDLMPLLSTLQWRPKGGATPAGSCAAWPEGFPDFRAARPPLEMPEYTIY